MIFSLKAFLLEFVQVVVVVVFLAPDSGTIAKIIYCCVNLQTCLAPPKAWVGPMSSETMKSSATMMQVGPVDGVSKDKDNGEFKQDGGDAIDAADLLNDVGVEGEPDVVARSKMAERTIRRTWIRRITWATRTGTPRVTVILSEPQSGREWQSR